MKERERGRARLTAGSLGVTCSVALLRRWRAGVATKALLGAIPGFVIVKFAGAGKEMLALGFEVKANVESKQLFSSWNFAWTEYYEVQPSERIGWL